MKHSPEQRNAIAEWGVTILVALWASSSVAWPFVVPTGSMENTVLVGDHLIVDKLAYSPPGPISKHLLPYTEVKRGDIIVFRYPLDLKQNYVKRVIGVPGDRIRFERQQLILNGKPAKEPYKVHKSGHLDSYRDYFPSTALTSFVDPRGLRMLRDHVVNGELVVPPGQYFAMGDNRDESWDSRYWGLVPRENIAGKPWAIYWSFEAGHPEGLQQTANLDHYKDVLLNFFSKTRWDRTFHIPKPYPLE